MAAIAGIYMIERVATGQCYVGSSVDVIDRWRDHRADLRNGRHCASRLQRAWAKDGPDAFAFTILQVCEASPEQIKQMLKEREQYWIDQLCPVFNTLKAAYSSLGFKHSEATKAKFRMRVVNEEVRALLRAAQTGVKRSPESVAKSRQAQIGRVKSAEEIAKTTQSRRAGVGYSPSQETRKKISRSLTGVKQTPERVAKNHPFAGRKHTAESIAKMVGRKQTPEAIEKSRLARTGRKATPEQIEKARRAKLGTVTSAETKEKLRNAILGRKHSPEAIAKMRKPKSPQHAAKIKQAQVGRTHTEASKEKMRAAARARHERERLEREQRQQPPP